MEKFEDKARAFETESISRLLYKYSLPAIVGIMVNAIYNIVDRIFIGQGVGSLAISGLAITFPIIILQAAFGMLIGIGGSTRISIALGQKDKEKAEKILGTSIILSIFFSLLFISVSFTWLDEILHLFGGTDKTIPFAREYMEILIPGSIFSTLTYSFNNMMRSSGYPTKAMIVMLTSAVLNAILAALFIFVFHWGIRGAAIATVISMFSTTVLVMHHYFSKSSYIRFHRRNIKLDMDIAHHIISIGMSPFLMNVASCMVNVILNNALLKHGGELAIGANGVINSLSVLVVMGVIGFCQGMQPIIGYNFGAGNRLRMKQTLSLTIRIASVVTLTGFAMAMLIPKQIAMAFTTDPKLIELSVLGLRTTLLLTPIIGFQIVTSSFFQSIGMVKVSIFLSLSRQVLFLIPMILLLPNIFGLKGVWMATPFADFISAMFTMGILYYNRKVFTSQTT